METILIYPKGKTLRFPTGYQVFGRPMLRGEIVPGVWHLAYIDKPRPKIDPLRQVAAFEWVADTKNLEYRKEWTVNDRSPEAIAATLNSEAEAAREAVLQELAREELNIKYLAELDAIATLTDEEATEKASRFPPFEIGKSYDQYERFFNPRDGKLYRVAQDHTSAIQWLPHENPALYTAILPPGEIGPWVQPTGAQDAYQVGDRVTHNRSTWECVAGDAQGNNSWEPGEFGWDKIA